jgi:BirA family biotin operon repressor/biotin-[acetyl-CoA-carboxylase] ligase
VIKQTVECRWPNDILLNGKKCCGILLENSFLQDRFDFSVVGIGINVNQASFEDDLANRATSLFKELGHTFDRTSVLQELLREADRLLPSLERGEVLAIMEQWNSRCSMFGKPVVVTHGDDRISGTAVRLNGQGGLVVDTPAGESTFYAGDVTIVQ